MYDVYDSFNQTQSMFNIVFVLLIGILIFRLIQSLTTWQKNNNSPRLDVRAKIVTKRSDISYYDHRVGNDLSREPMRMVDTTYYVTFEVESGDRMEFKVSSSEYGMLAEGDVGKLTFQGTRYLGFIRE